MITAAFFFHAQESWFHAVTSLVARTNEWLNTLFSLSKNENFQCPLCKVGWCAGCSRLARFASFNIRCAGHYDLINVGFLYGANLLQNRAACHYYWYVIRLEICTYPIAETIFPRKQFFLLGFIPQEVLPPCTIQNTTFAKHSRADVEEDWYNHIPVLFAITKLISSNWYV